MVRFVLRRLGFMVPIALGIIFFCFLGLEMTQNSTAHRASYNIPRFVDLAWRDTVTYLRQAAHGDLGLAWQGQGRIRRAVPVQQMLADTYPKSLGLLALALAVATGFGVLGGLFGALRERSSLTSVVMTATVLGVSTPSFFTALLLQIAEIRFYNRAGFRLVPVAGFGWDAHMLLPSLVLSARPLAHIARVTLVTMREVLDQDYVRTALAKGLPNPAIWGRHALRNAAVPILTGVGVSLRFSLSSLPVVEYFFNWPGLGATLLDGIRTRQSSLVVTLALALGLTFMALNLLLDVCYRLIDPRFRQRGAAS
jgi:peptide/nickel transport system permease protein